MNDNEHFQGFAKLLIPELDEQVGAVIEWGLEHDASEKEIAQELASRWNTLIAQRAYDLVFHAITCVEKFDFDTYILAATDKEAFALIHKAIAEIPDLTQWPKPHQP